MSCNFCPKSFKSHISLERHLFLLHSPEKHFPCIHCNATCPNKDILDAHLLSHGSGKPFSCSFCGKDFTRKYHLDRHLLYTSCDKSRRKHETACHVCGKLFSRTDNLREHLRAHIGQSTRKRDYQCPHCEKSFYGSSLLKFVQICLFGIMFSDLRIDLIWFNFTAFTFERIQVRSHFVVICAKSHSRQMEHYESIVDLILAKSHIHAKRVEKVFRPKKR